MDEIAAAAGVSRQTVYAHYPTRDALLRAVTLNVTAEVVRALGELDLDHGSVTDALGRWVHARWALLKRYPVLLTPAIVAPEGDDEAERHEPLTRGLRQVIERGRRRREFDPRSPRRDRLPPRRRLRLLLRGRTSLLPGVLHGPLDGRVRACQGACDRLARRPPHPGHDRCRCRHRGARNATPARARRRPHHPDIYAHVLPESERKAAEVMEAILHRAANACPIDVLNRSYVIFSTSCRPTARTLTLTSHTVLETPPAEGLWITHGSPRRGRRRGLADFPALRAGPKVSVTRVRPRAGAGPSRTAVLCRHI